MRIPRTLFPALFLTGLLAAQPAAPQPPPPGGAGPQTPAPAPAATLRAQYKWGYAGVDGQGKGTLNVLLEPGTGRTVLELMGLGERLVLLEGDAASGYRVQIPREKVDQRAATLGAMPLPFLPQVGSPEALRRLLAQGEGPGVKVTRRDSQGPVKLRYDGRDDRNKEVTVWLERTRWEEQRQP